MPVEAIYHEAGMTAAIFISPHLDDAALSCGGGITRLVSAGVPVTVISVFTADQKRGRPLSPHARRTHESWAVGDQPFAVRRKEDIAAMARLGASCVHLGLHDAVYRRSESGRPLYTTAHSRVAADDIAQVLPEVERRLRKAGMADVEGVRIFCPAAACDHPDHTLTRLAVEQLVSPGALVFYEEYPYHVQLGFGAIRDSGLDDAVSQAICLSPAELQGRIDAVACYESQLRGLFPTAGERVREVLSAHIPVVGPKMVRPYDASASRARMESCIRSDTVMTCGECYHWSHSAAAPFPACRLVDITSVV